MKAAVSTPPTAEVALHEAPGLPASTELLDRLGSICASRGQVGLADRLADLADFVAQDMVRFEAELGDLVQTGLPPQPRLVGKSAHHLLDLGGKRLRPMCVVLASHLGSANLAEVLDLSVAAELVHNATLLHDDVVDLSDSRRGAPTARAVFGNAASIFAGDWVLVEALRRVQRCRLPGLMEQLFDTIEEMILAESLQLENRGRLAIGRDVYFRIVEGKTASVFRWAMAAGAAAAGLGDGERRVLEDYGLQVGIAFQAIDDLLDLTGDVEHTGKELFTDLREGKMTYPLIVAMERDLGLRRTIEEILAIPAEAPVPQQVAARVVASLRETMAVDDCLELARASTARALASLAQLPASRARRALETVAEAIVNRDL